MIKVHIFHTGKVKVDIAIPHKEKNPLAVTGFFRSKEKQVILPVSCYLIEHPKGNVLIDTGWDSKYINEKPHRFFGLLDSISAPIIKEGESIDCKLSNVGIKPSNLDYVLFSHLDFDHTSWLRLVKYAKKFMASKEEVIDSNKYFFRYVKENWNFCNIDSFSYNDTGIGPVGKSFDLFNDGSIVLVNTPGHSHGLFTTLIKNNDKFIILTGDAAYTQKSFTDKVIPGFTVDKKLALKSLDWICELSKDKNCIGVFANHDPSVKEQLI